MASRFFPKLALGASFVAASAGATKMPYDQYLAIASLMPNNNDFNVDYYEGDAKEHLICKDKSNTKVPTKDILDNLFLKSDPTVTHGEKVDEKVDFTYLNIFRESLNDCGTPEECKQAFVQRVNFFEKGCENKELADRYKAYMYKGLNLLIEPNMHIKLTSLEIQKINAILAAAEPDTTCRDCCCAWSLLCGAATAVAGISMGTYYLMFGCEDEAAAAVKEDQEEITICVRKRGQILNTLILCKIITFIAKTP